jgi:hypothetical protein
MEAGHFLLLVSVFNCIGARFGVTAARASPISISDWSGDRPEKLGGGQ